METSVPLGTRLVVCGIIDNVLLRNVPHINKTLLRIAHIAALCSLLVLCAVVNCTEVGTA